MKTIGISTLLAPFLAAMLAGPAFAAEGDRPESAGAIASPAECDAVTTAANYDRRAKADEEAADRYRTWASAEEMFGSGNAFGRKPTTQYYEEQARTLEVAAKQNRDFATRIRAGIESRRADACAAGAATPANG